MNPYLHLLAANKGRGFVKVAAEATADEATLYLYDVIVSSDLEAELFGGIAPETFAQALRGINASTIHLRINSPGGSVFAARAMEQALREHPARVVAHIDGYAASAATAVMMGADRIEAAPGAMLMIHKAWTFAMGNADDLVAQAALLEKVDGTLATSYASAAARRLGEAGAKADAFATAMAAETWYTAPEAVAAGLIDSVKEDAPAAQARAQAWDLSAYRNAPAAAPAAAAPNTAALLRSIAVREAALTV